VGDPTTGARGVGLRRASRADLGRLTALAATCFSEPWSEAALASALAQPGARVWLASALPLAEHPEALAEVVGFVVARRIADVLEIDLVGVAPPARRRGVADRLLRALLDSEADGALNEARLELSAANAAAGALYAGLGFVVVGRRPRYYPDGSDALLLTRASTG